MDGIEEFENARDRIAELEAQVAQLREALLGTRPGPDRDDGPCWCDYEQEHIEGPSQGCGLARAALAPAAGRALLERLEKAERWRGEVLAAQMLEKAAQDHAEQITEERDAALYEVAKLKAQLHVRSAPGLSLAQYEAMAAKEDDRIQTERVAALTVERDAALARAEEADRWLKEARAVAEDQHGRFVKAFERAEAAEERHAQLVLHYQALAKDAGKALDKVESDAFEEAAQVADELAYVEDGALVGAAIRALKGDRS